MNNNNGSSLDIVDKNLTFVCSSYLIAHDIVYKNFVLRKKWGHSHLLRKERTGADLSSLASWSETNSLKCSQILLPEMSDIFLSSLLEASDPTRCGWVMKIPDLQFWKKDFEVTQTFSSSSVLKTVHKIFFYWFMLQQANITTKKVLH